MLDYDIIYGITTPLYIISLYYLFNTFFNKSNNKKIEISSYFIFGILQYVYYFISTIPIINLLFGMTCYFFISLNYKTTILNRILNILYILFITLSIETAITLIFLNVENNIFVYGQLSTPSVIFIIRAITLVSSILLSRYAKGYKKEFKLPYYHYFLYFIILVGILYLYISSVHNNRLSLTSSIINSLVLVAVAISITKSEEKIYKSLIIYAERNILKEQNLSYENQNNLINQSDENIKGIKHDIKNHLITLNSIFQNEDKESAVSYINSLINNIEQEDRLVLSDNYVIDSILNFKLQQVKELNVELSIDIKVPKEIKISAYELTIILGNLIDNAINALKHTTGDKKLNITIGFEKGNFIIFIKNNFNGKIKIKDGTIRTIKNNKSKHGFGLENIKKVLENYYGTIDIKYDDKFFSVIVLIPYKDEL